MRTTQDLRREFDWVDATPVDTSDLLSRITVGIDTHRIAQRRRVAVLSVAAAAILLVVGAVVVPSLGNDRSDRGQVANNPTPTSDQPRTSAISSLRHGFTIPELPWYPSESAIGESTWTGAQEFGIDYGIDDGIDDDSNPRHLVLLFDPEMEELTGIPAPVPTGESIAIDSPTEGSVMVQVIEVDTNEDEQPRFGIGWEVGDGEWLTIVSKAAPGRTPREAALEIAAHVVLGPAQRLTFPFQVGSPPTGFDLITASRDLGLGIRTAALAFVAGDISGSGKNFGRLTITAKTITGVPEGYSPNTTLGPYQAQLGSLALLVFDVQGFLISFENGGTPGSVDEAELRRIAESIVIIPDAANDMTVWTDQPIG